MGTAGARIAFICTTPAHLNNNGGVVDHLTIHENVWAYCPADVRKGEHEWNSTGGVSLGELEVLVRGMRERNGSNGSRTDPAR